MNHVTGLKSIQCLVGNSVSFGNYICIYNVFTLIIYNRNFTHIDVLISPFIDWYVSLEIISEKTLKIYIY